MCIYLVWISSENDLMLMQVLLLKLLLALMVVALALAMMITTKVVKLITLVMMTTVALFPRTGRDQLEWFPYFGCFCASHSW